MTTEQFWQKAHDIFHLHYVKHQYTILTEDEKRETVTDFLVDADSLASEWYNRNYGEDSDDNKS